MQSPGIKPMTLAMLATAKISIIWGVGDAQNRTSDNLTTASSANSTFVRPPAFFINGFSNIPHAKYYYLFLCLVYTVTVFGNSFIMSTIYLARRLHTAKYVAVFHLALCDICGSSALIPKLIDMFLFDNQYVSYESCLANMFFVLHFMNLQSFTLLILAYDRVIAICCPLKYHAIITKSSISCILCASWICSFILFTALVGLVNRLSFCRSIVVNSYYCEHGPVISLSCNNNSINYYLAYLFFGLLICAPVALISISYLCIAAALLKIAHGTDRMKAMKTCTSHLALVAIFYLPILSVNVKSISTSIDPNARIINNSLTQIIPPMLNPIIYTLKTEEVLQSIKELYKRNKVATNAKRKNVMRNT
ncbi:olfactory receptor 143-like [Triplophysa dalaica]|uniref:olfactory receptor 143-like n=1 Tax=Triplophysa dalaica TaxID=1582913 RepID=UPI0024DFA392|nr:olfactory receptor 143-like [Triplophysa dalaica]